MTAADGPIVLVVVGHPDDEALWIGGTLLALCGSASRRVVVSLTHAANPIRRAEFEAACAALDALPLMLDLPDGGAVALPEIAPFLESALASSGLGPSNLALVLTHAADGNERGHWQHQQCHRQMSAWSRRHTIPFGFFSERPLLRGGLPTVPEGERAGLHLCSFQPVRLASREGPVEASVEAALAVMVDRPAKDGLLDLYESQLPGLRQYAHAGGATEYLYFDRSDVAAWLSGLLASPPSRTPLPPSRSQDLPQGLPRSQSMYTHVLEVTTVVGCKNLCEYCPQEKNIQAYKKHSRNIKFKYDDFVRYLDKVPLSTAVYFGTTSEPWFNPDFNRMLKHAYDRGHTVRVYTTLVDVTEDDIAFLKTMMLERVTVHLPSAEGRERYTATEEYQHILRCIVAADIPNIQYMSIGTVHPDARKWVPQVREQAFETLTDFAGNLVNGAAPSRPRLSGPLTCMANRFHWNTLYPSGEVCLCCEDFGMTHVLGNLGRDSYEDLFQSEEFNRVRRGMIDDRIDVLCRHCEYARPLPRKTIDETADPSVPALKPVAPLPQDLTPA